MNYGKAIRIIRAAKGLSQKELSQMINVDPSFLSRLEAGERVPSVETLESISKKLGVPLHLLMLLGSDNKEDLKNISTDNASQLGKALLQILIEAEA